MSRYNEFAPYHPTFEHRPPMSEGYWSSGISDTVNTRAFHSNMYDTYTTTATSKQIDSSTQLSSLYQEPSSSNRRSHRPRGCRGGRKNRKAKATGNKDSDISPPQSPDRPIHKNGSYNAVAKQYMNDTFVASIPNQSPVMKGDLSPYQHVKTNKSWNFGSQNFNNTVSLNRSTSSPYKNTQMLPPPVPSALFDVHRQNIEAMNNHNLGLKMLPSFGDDEDAIDDESAESFDGSISIPPPPQSIASYGDVVPTQGCHTISIGTTTTHKQYNGMEYAAKIDTGLPSSRCRSVSDDFSAIETEYNGGNNIFNSQDIQHEAIPRPLFVDLYDIPKYQNFTGSNGSLFVTSPRSFLFGASSNYKKKV